MAFLFLLSCICVGLKLVQSRQELPYGQLVFQKKERSGGHIQLTEQVKFSNSVECIKYYNQIVFELAEKSSSKGYEMTDWTVNQFTLKNEQIAISRFGNKIQMIKVCGR